MELIDCHTVYVPLGLHVGRAAGDHGRHSAGGEAAVPGQHQVDPGGGETQTGRGVAGGS